MVSNLQGFHPSRSTSTEWLELFSFQEPHAGIQPSVQTPQMEQHGSTTPRASNFRVTSNVTHPLWVPWAG